MNDDLIKISDRIIRAANPKEFAEATQNIPQALGVFAETGRALRALRGPVDNSEKGCNFVREKGAKTCLKRVHSSSPSIERSKETFQ